jgi:hypothetical protein
MGWQTVPGGTMKFLSTESEPEIPAAAADHVDAEWGIGEPVNPVTVVGGKGIEINTAEEPVDPVDHVGVWRQAAPHELSYDRVPLANVVAGAGSEVATCNLLAHNSSPLFGR